MSWLATKLISVFLLPPLNLLLLAGAGWVLIPRHPRLGRLLLGTSLAALWLISTPLISRSLVGLLEREPALSVPVAREAEAIVILGGGTYFNAPEYGQDTVSAAALERIRYGAFLHRTTGKPILVTGGNPQRAAIAEAEQMKQALTRDFGVPVRWVEDAANNTRENALLSRKMLVGEKISHIYLVTHAWHMPRAKAAFERAGFTVVPAPTAFNNEPLQLTALSFLPHAKALHDSHHFFHEIAGLLWYRIQG